MASTETVVVGCKLPQGLLLNFKGETVRVQGVAQYRMPNPARKGHNDPRDIHFGDGLTTISKDFWEGWKEANKDFPPLLRGLIYANKSQNDALACARDTETVKTGLEPLDPTKPGKGIEPAEGTLKTLQENGARAKR